jgi:hypothetical protein
MIVFVDSSMLIPLRRAIWSSSENHQDFSEDDFPSAPIFEAHHSKLQRILNARNVPFPFARLPREMLSLLDSEEVTGGVEPTLGRCCYRPATPRPYLGEDLGQQLRAPHFCSGLPFLGTLCYHHWKRPVSATTV